MIGRPGAAPQPDPDRAARRALARHRAIATGLLVLMAALTLGTFYLPRGYWTDLLQAAAKAGFVGGIADWFAVTALFRHPLGLPIPHTAIIPREKARLGAALGRFVSRHVLAEQEVHRFLARFDVGDLLRTILTGDRVVRPLAQALAGYVPRVLATVEDGRARRLMARLLPRLIGGAGTGRVVARALRTLVEGGRHQEVLSFTLEKLRETMRDKELELRAMIEERVREQGGRLVGWALGATIATRILTFANAEFDRMEGGGSALRDAFDEWVRREIDRIERDPERAAEIGRGLRRLLSHESVQAWGWDVWARLRAALEADTQRPEGRVATVLETALRNLGALIATDAAARGRVQQATEQLLRGLLPAAQPQIAGFIADVVGSWDTATITERLELRVGKDLQYVRMNGTIVGFLVGGAAYAALLAIFGRVSF